MIVNFNNDTPTSSSVHDLVRGCEVGIHGDNSAIMHFNCHLWSFSCLDFLAVSVAELRFSYLVINERKKRNCVWLHQRDLYLNLTLMDIA